MVHPCIVSGCKNKAKDGIYRFPRDLELRKKWLESINCNDTWDPDDENQLANAEAYRICGLHFKSSDFKRDLKGELLGVPSKRKILIPGAVPSTEKQERPKSQSKSKQRSRVNNLSNLNPGIIESGITSYPSPLLIVGDSTKGVINLNSTNEYSSARALLGKQTIKKSKQTNSRNLSLVQAGHEFDIKKSSIIAKIKKEAEENVLKENVLASLNLQSSTTDPVSEGETPSKVRRLPPQQCVILKPVSTPTSSDSGKSSEDHKEPPPIIIPGNPEKSIRLLKDEKGINFIEKEIEKHYEQKIPASENTNKEDTDKSSKGNEEEATAIILTSLCSLDEKNNDKCKNNKTINRKEHISFGNSNVKSLPPLRMKPEPCSQQDIDINPSHSSTIKSFESNSLIYSGSQTIPSRKCTVLDLLFDREDTFEDQQSNSLENIPPPDPVPDDSRLSVIIFKNNKIATANEPSAVVGSKDTTINSNIKSINNKNVKYAIFDPSGLKSELDKYKEEVKKLRKENYGLKIKNQTLRNDRNKLTKKVEIREKLMETRRRKSKKDMDTIAKLRTELSKLRQLRNKMRRREYNRKAKHEKVLERRKKRRQFIQEQIDLGVMDKSQLSLVYSRKKLPYERKQTNMSHHMTHEKEKKNVSLTPNKTSQVPIGMTIVEHHSNANILPTPTVEYIIEHDGQFEENNVEGETVIQVENYYQSLENENAVTDQETNAAVAGISNSNFQDMEEKEADSESIEIATTNYDSSHISIANEHLYTTPSTSQKLDSRTVKIIRLQNPLQAIPRSKNSFSPMKSNAQECSAENLDFIVKAVNELERNNSAHLVPSSSQANIPTIPSNISNYRSTSMKKRPATFVLLPPSSTSEQKK